MRIRMDHGRGHWRNHNDETTAIVGGNGKTGWRVAERLERAGRPVRSLSRSSNVPFDWEEPATWAPALRGAGSLYLTYHPDLAVPGAAEKVQGVVHAAVEQGVERIVLLAGRGEPQVHPAEDAVRASGVAHTILECAFFAQNFDEGLLFPVAGSKSQGIGRTMGRQQRDWPQRRRDGQLRLDVRCGLRSARRAVGVQAGASLRVELYRRSTAARDMLRTGRIADGARRLLRMRWPA